MRFLLDGELDGHFVEAPTGKATWDYNVPVYHREGLSNGPHTITLASGVLGGPNTLVLLDYMVFITTSDAGGTLPPTSISSVPTSTDGRPAVLG